MKKYIKLFLIAIVIIFITPNVYAREFTISGVNFSIEGVKINLYEMNFTKDEEDNSTINPEDLKNYALKKPTKTVTIDINNLKYHPKYTLVNIDNSKNKGDIKDSNSAFIDMNFDFSDTNIPSYLTNDIINNTSKTKGYLFELVLQIKFTNLPTEIKHGYLVNGSVRDDIGDEMENYTYINEFDLNKTTDYVINGGYLVDKRINYYNSFYSDVEREEQKNNSTYDLATTLEKEINMSVITFIEHIALADGDKENANSFIEFAFTDLADFDDFMEYYTGEMTNATITNSGDLKEVTYDTIPVPNTALDFSKVVYIIGYVLIIGGAYLLLRFKTKKGTN